MHIERSTKFDIGDPAYFWNDQTGKVQKCTVVAISFFWEFDQKTIQPAYFEQYSVLYGDSRLFKAFLPFNILSYTEREVLNQAVKEKDNTNKQ